MTSTRCPICVGSGEIMGGGMIMMDCKNCHGIGKLHEIKIEKPLAVGIDKRSKTYRESIAKIMELHDCDREKASAIFDEEFDKLPA